jgi:sortase A
MENRKIMLTAGIGTALLLGSCIVALGLTGLLSWQIFQPSDQPGVIRIAPLAPLTTRIAQNQIAELSAEAANTPAVDPPPNSESDPPPTTVEEPTSPASTPAPTPNVEEVLGFSLPENSVNSVVQEGVASRLLVPRLNLDAPVVISPIKNQTWQVDHLGQSVGHLEGTASPGANSNIVLAGHVTLDSGVYGPFAGLAQLSPGDLLTVYQGDQKFNYVVDSQKVVERTTVEVTYPTDTPQITLITCSNWNGEAGRYEQRLVVKGHLVN